MDVNVNKNFINLENIDNRAAEYLAECSLLFALVKRVIYRVRRHLP